MENIRKLPLEEATQWANEAIDELLGRGGCTPEDEDVRAIETLRSHAENVSDRWAANIYLIVIGVICSALSVVCGAAGVYHAFHGHAEAGIIGLYAAGFFAAGWVSLLGVQRR